VSEPFFPPPQKKESAPYRVAAPVPALPVSPTPRVSPTLARRAAKPAPEDEVEAPSEESEPFLVRFAWRFAAKVAALAVTGGILWALVRAHELGARWPQAVLIVLGVVGILSAPVVLYFRLRRLVRLLFARSDDD
jgi:hypothetical protein